MKLMSTTVVCGKKMNALRVYLTCSDDLDGGVRMVTGGRGNPLSPTCFEEKDEKGGYAVFLRSTRAIIVTIAEGKEIGTIEIKKHRVVDGKIISELYFIGKIRELEGGGTRFKEAAKRVLGTPPCFHCECKMS